MALLFVIMFRCPAPLPLIRSKRYINTRIAPKPVQEEAKGEGRALHWRRPPVPFPGSNLTLIPGLFPFRGNRDLNQQQPRLSASAYKRDTEISVSLEVQFRTCRSEQRQRSAISSWLFPLVQIRLRTAAALSSRIFCTRSCIG